MKLVVFDTETTGLFDPGLDPLHWDQPWPIQLGVIVLENWEIVETLNTIILPPDGVLFSPEAVALHGISPDVCLEVGKPIQAVFNVFQSMCHGAEIISSFHFKFDGRIMETTNKRLERKEPLWSPDTYTHCIMIQSQEYLMARLKLGQVYRRLFGKPLQDAHDAFADAIAAMEIFRLMTAELTLPES